MQATVRHGAPLVVIQGILRHKRLSTTARYVKRPDHLRLQLQLQRRGSG